MKHIILLALLGAAAQVSGGPGGSWTYNGDFITAWGNLYDVCKNEPNRPGFRQSPMNIQSALATPKTETQFCFSANYWKKHTGNLFNTEHGIQFDFPQPGPTVSGGVFGSTVYTLLQVHCHWGNGLRSYPNPNGGGMLTGQGSEHFIDDVSYMAECHFVHAAGPTDLAVLGFLFKATAATSNDFLASMNLGSGTLRLPGASKSWTLDLAAVFSLANLSEYFNYPGSLTTPDCREQVTWVLFKNPLDAIPANTNKLNKIRDGSNVLIKNNWRPPLPLGAYRVGKLFDVTAV